MRKRGKVDGPQEAIVAALRQAGCSVLSLAPLGGGIPDLHVWRQDATGGHYYLLEVKTTGGRLTAAQKAFHAAWGGPIYVVRTPLEALNAVGIEVRP